MEYRITEKTDKTGVRMYGIQQWSRPWYFPFIKKWNQVSIGITWEYCNYHTVYWTYSASGIKKILKDIKCGKKP